jgi:hypothetical protein
MANNINKVVYGNDTLIDLTADTVTASDVLSGVTFHTRSGASATGTLEPAEPLTTEHLNALRAIIQG